MSLASKVGHASSTFAIALLGLPRAAPRPLRAPDTDMRMLRAGHCDREGTVFALRRNAAVIRPGISLASGPQIYATFGLSHG